MNEGVEGLRPATQSQSAQGYRPLAAGSNTPDQGGNFSLFGRAIIPVPLEQILPPVIRKTVDKAEANRGDILTYTVTFANPMVSAAPVEYITDHLPNTLEFVGADSAIGSLAYNAATHTVRWDINQIVPSGTEYTATIQARVKPDASGVLVNVVRYTTDLPTTGGDEDEHCIAYDEAGNAFWDEAVCEAPTRVHDPLEPGSQAATGVAVGILLLLLLLLLLLALLLRRKRKQDDIEDVNAEDVGASASQASSETSRQAGSAQQPASRQAGSAEQPASQPAQSGARGDSGAPPGSSETSSQSNARNTKGAPRAKDV